MVARYVRDVEVPGSNPGSPTRKLKKGTLRCPSSYSSRFDSHGVVEEMGESQALA